jgi:2-amino-4-hydroxy-6-hydroxymethyldihydropteridine diphosphokinase
MRNDAEEIHIAYLALGANLGDRQANLQTALKLIAGKVGSLSAISSVYESDPWGYHSENRFLNQVVSVETALSPLKLLHVTQAIEKEMGRTKKSQQGYHDREIDIDIILYDDLVCQSDELELPHPLFHLRSFVLEPLKEINPELIHPVLQKKISEF